MEHIEIAVKVLGATSKAILVDHGGKENVWIPISQIDDYTGDSVAKATSIFIPEWLATEKGIL